MVAKHPVYPQRIRKIPEQFSWVDHRLVRDGHIERCSHASAALYLFLVTVSDARGLSFYSDASIMKRLAMEPTILDQSRFQLVDLELIAYKKPIYQVLPLNKPAISAQNPCSKQSQALQSLGQIFSRIRETNS